MLTPTPEKCGIGEANSEARPRMERRPKTAGLVVALVRLVLKKASVHAKQA